LEQHVLVGTTLRIQRGEALTIGRTSFSIDSPDHWTTTLYVENVNNERGSPLVTYQTFRDWDARVRPRTFGAQIEYRF
jgi:iron complex outermembrane recepter protein